MSSQDEVQSFRDQLATALKMDKDQDWRPKISLQARGKMAERLCELAETYEIPVVKDVDLAEDLKFLEVGSDLPTELFSPVAEILAHIYLISKKAKQENLSLD
jgi:type III secretion system FlhB-like substrate exporter